MRLGSAGWCSVFSLRVTRVRGDAISRFDSWVVGYIYLFRSSMMVSCHILILEHFEVEKEGTRCRVCFCPIIGASETGKHLMSKDLTKLWICTITVSRGIRWANILGLESFIPLLLVHHHLWLCLAHSHAKRCLNPTELLPLLQLSTQSHTNPPLI